MAITLDGHVYNLRGTGYNPIGNRIYSDDRGLTGYPLRTETGVIAQEYDLTLICTTTEITALRASYKKADYTVTPPTALLDFIDEEGTHWNPTASGSGNLNTGVYFASPLRFEPMTENGWQSQNRFLAKIHLLVNDNGSFFS